MGWGGGGGSVFIVNGREMSWPASAYGDAVIDNRDLALIVDACRWVLHRLYFIPYIRFVAPD